MENIIGKKFKYIGTNDIKTIKEVKNDRIYFTDNGSVESSRFGGIFEAVEEAKTLNPDTFFNTDATLSSNLGDILSHQFEDMKKNPQAYVQQKEERPIMVDGKDISGLDPETVKWMKEQEQEQKRNVEAVKVDPWMKQFGDTGGEVRTVETGQSEKELELVHKKNKGEKIEEVENHGNNTTSKLSSLPKMKNSYKVVLKLELNELIPKIEDIRALENVFDISLTDEIAEKIANKYLNDRELFVGMVTAELDKIINKKKVVKKPTIKKPTIKKPTK